MLCIYFEIPYERQLVRIAPLEIQTILNTVTDMAVSNGAASFKMPYASVYRFSDNEAAPVFSANLFLRFLAETVRTHKDRIMDYRVIIDCCGESDADDLVADHFTAYQNRLLPSRSFFASAAAERLLQSYINFEYTPRYGLYSCANFIVPKTHPAAEGAKQSYRLYLLDGVNWVQALYHFMLMHPVSEQDLAEQLSDEEKKRYDAHAHAIAYFRKHRFCTVYPRYFIDAFVCCIQLYFRIFTNLHAAAEITLFYSKEHAEAAAHIVELIPSIHSAVQEDAPFNPDTVPADFMQLAYLTVYAAQFIFTDEIAEFFASLHKNTGFVASLYEWLYATGIIEEKENIHALNTRAAAVLAQQPDRETADMKRLIAAFLWGKYTTGQLSPDEQLKDIFENLRFQPEERFLLHYFFHKYRDTELAQADIKPFKSARFFSSLDAYQKALKANRHDHSTEAAYAVKTAVSALQQPSFPAGEYHALFRIACMHLSQNKIEDAVTYFQYALDSAETLNDGEWICETLLRLGISYFVQNNLHEAQHTFARLHEALTDHFEQPQHIPYLFMQGRIALQLGDYGTAELRFEEAAHAAQAYFQVWEPLCRIWYARARAHRGQTDAARQILAEYRGSYPDAQIFFIESYLLEPYSPALQSDAPLPAEPLPSAAAPYQSGFILAEERVWSSLYDKPVREVCYAAFNSYYRFRIALAAADNAAQTYLNTLEETAREALRYRDIAAPLYAYLCYDAFLLKDGSDSDAANGYLSRSFKAFQNCMENMTENTIRDKFIFRNVWNAKLYAAAQQNKLI